MIVSSAAVYTGQVLLVVIVVWYGCLGGLVVRSLQTKRFLVLAAESYF